jgi:hypothetical protein
MLSVMSCIRPNWRKEGQICDFSFDLREFKLECNRTLFVFAPEGRDVYSLAVLSLFRSSVGAQLFCPLRVPLRGFAPSGARSLGVRS